jgi:glyoxylase-like metal-dependent hydrolase (beta-lactamase superfamily II)
LILKTVVVGPLATNCYILARDSGGPAFVIDPGEDVLDIIDALDEDNLKVGRILITHGHFDHTQAAWDLKKARGGDILSHTGDGLPGTDGELKDGQQLELNGVVLTVWYTPGHSKGSVSLVGKKEVFCGDLLFQGSVGRTDFEGGSVDELMASLDRLRELADTTAVFPGHGPATNIGVERATNPYMLLRETADGQ